MVESTAKGLGLEVNIKFDMTCIRLCSHEYEIYECIEVNKHISHSQLVIIIVIFKLM
jgi:hypothetical protein